MSAQATRKAAALLSIGQVLAKLGPEFPDLSPSKLRFLEDQGLISPQRTPSGYRKFDAADVERLRYILTLQRDHYLPLKVILSHLDDIDAGRAPQIPGANVRLEAPSILGTERRRSRSELQTEAGATKQLLADAISAQLLPGTEPFGDAAVQALRALVELQRFGIEPRHLRGMRQSAQREAALIESALKPMRGRRETGSQAKAAEAARDLANQIQAVRDILTREALGA
ncbi:MerR family transcriptional regulator [Agrococcus sp. HG114]|uniref:transcriptional regulator FtsR n=1 Tax=Agrococcus sp. HG114 TaxID=2969757 RepID=UPI00215A9422|nr:MerR family transcriptional regulator [Agrococcus sp. HG114]MCR8670894.1 MerR family transcriptional regulator [Agrococcus sp. HG114]